LIDGYAPRHLEHEKIISRKDAKQESRKGLSLCGFLSLRDIIFFVHAKVQRSKVAEGS